MKPKKYRHLFLLGILIRLLMMPFFAHEDILHTYRRAERLAFQGVPFYKFSDPLPHLIEGLNLKFFAIFTGPDYFQNIHQLFPYIEQLNAKLFIFKLPYLLAEIILWYCLFKFLIKLNKTNVLLVVFNPIMLYSVYLFGRYESFTLLAIVLLMTQLKKQINLLKVGILLLLVVMTRFSLLMILPAWLFLKLKPRAKIGSLLGLSLVGSLAVIKKGGLAKFGNYLQHSAHTQYLFQAKISLGHHAYLYLFFVILAVFLWILVKTLREAEEQSAELSNLQRFSLASLVIIISYYASAIFHPQYASWFLPFFYIIFDQSRDKKILKKLFITINALFFVVIFFWGTSTTLGLLTPTSRFAAFPPMEDLMYFYDYRQLSNLGKSLLSGTFIFLLIEILNLVKKYKITNGH